LAFARSLQGNGIAAAETCPICAGSPDEHHFGALV
jgi:hypothetical protein